MIPVIPSCCLRLLQFPASTSALHAACFTSLSNPIALKPYDDLWYWYAFPTLSNGGAKEDRTPDLLRARQALSQLSYGPKQI